MVPTREDWLRDPFHQELEAMIVAGWGEVPRMFIPEDWRTRRPAHGETLKARWRRYQNGQRNGNTDNSLRGEQGDIPA